MSSEKTIAIVGGGFAGYTLVKRLSRSGLSLKIILINPHRYSVFLPLLPDVVSGKIKENRLIFDLGKFCRKRGINFIQQQAVTLEDNKRLKLQNGETIEFDFLAIAAGMQPNFYGNKRAQKIAFTLAGITDARILQKNLENILRRGDEHTFVVVGGGYTGIEIASALAWAIKKSCPRQAHLFPVKVAELAPKVLGNLPEDLALTVKDEISRMGIEVITNAKLEINDKTLIQINGGAVRNFTMVWSAGMKTVDFVQDLDFSRDRQGRLIVEKDLSLPTNPNIFGVGDCACFPSEQGPLRAAVQFSWAQGNHAGRNILRQIKGLDSLPYQPKDYGYLVPVASGKAWGKVLGRKVGGKSGSFLHYFMCIYRTLTPNNRIGIFRDLLG